MAVSTGMVPGSVPLAAVPRCKAAAAAALPGLPGAPSPAWSRAGHCTGGSSSSRLCQSPSTIPSCCTPSSQQGTCQEDLEKPLHSPKPTSSWLFCFFLKQYSKFCILFSHCRCNSRPREVSPGPAPLLTSPGSCTGWGFPPWNQEKVPTVASSCAGTDWGEPSACTRAYLGAQGALRHLIVIPAWEKTHPQAPQGLWYLRPALSLGVGMVWSLTSRVTSTSPSTTGLVAALSPLLSFRSEGIRVCFSSFGSTAYAVLLVLVHMFTS